MTRKEELLEFITDNITESNQLKINEMILTSPLDFIPDNTLGDKRFSCSKEKLIEVITNGFDDQLIGSVDTDETVIEILEWWA